MKRITTTLLLSLVAVVCSAQGLQDSCWTKKTLQTQFGFSQVSLTNWAAGGFGSLSLNGYIDGNLNYEKNNFKWTNRLQVGYGFVNNFGEGIKKTDDRLILDIKAGYEIAEKIYATGIYNFQTQLSKGYKSTKGTAVVSDFFAPAYTSLGFGIDFDPSNSVSINVSPLVGKIVMVKDPSLRVKYGNSEDQFVRFELGAQVKFDAKIEVQDVTAGTTLTLFSDYLDNPLNIKVNWDVSISAKLTSYLSATIRTYLIYDDKIKHIELRNKNNELVYDDDGKVVMVPGVQFKELSSFSFSYTFGKK